MLDAKAGQILRAAFPEVDSDDPSSYFWQQGDLFQALSFAWLFWPRLVELHGAIFVVLGGADETEISSRLTTPLANARSDWPPMAWPDAVDSYNWFEIDQLFRGWRGPGEVVSDAQECLAIVLVQTWLARLVGAYPERSFSVTLVQADEEAGLRIEVRQEAPQLETPKGWDGRRRFVAGSGQG
ncbi:hypothetical protein [Crossiella sp. CA198]|uniref:hypothetical protein n=1 Tax=Crossiella sp. CA198 TaxID=3455607 RepID=UPI003F8D3BA1